MKGKSSVSMHAVLSHIAKLATMDSITLNARRELGIKIMGICQRGSQILNARDVIKPLKKNIISVGNATMQDIVKSAMR